jgi:lipopolysaccharide biosynthesis glycosyltransferase
MSSPSGTQAFALPAIDVAMATDDHYAQHAAVVIHSLLEQHPHRLIRFHFLHGSSAIASLDLLRQMIEGAGAKYHQIQIPPEWEQRLDAKNNFGLHAWLRILLPELLPACDRILYLDSDLVINDRLDNLWATDLQGKLLAAVTNPLYPHQSPARQQALGIEDTLQYFNSGVLLMDLAAMRQQGWTEKLVKFAADNRSRILYPDQDTLNVVLAGHWLSLHPRYNAQAALFDLSPRELPFMQEESRAARRLPAIIHFTGLLKPWVDACNHPLRHLYWRHLRQTPWRGAIPLHPHWRNILLRLLPYRAYRFVWRLFPQRTNERNPGPAA